MAAEGDGASFGALVRTHRLRRHLTQEQLAEASGLSTRTVANVEKGRVRHPHGETVRMLADALELTEPERVAFRAAAGTAYWTGRQDAPAEEAPAGAHPVPAQLPGDVHPFCGRHAELAALDRLLPGAGAPPPTLITGPAGIGKTALAVHWAHRVRDHFPDGQLYVDLRGYDPDAPVAPADVLAAFLRAMGLPSARLPHDLTDRAALLRTLMAGRRILMVLDNAGTVEQIRPLLPGAGPAAVVVTSRDALSGLVAREGAHRLDLPALPRGDAVELLTALIGADADAGDLDTLADRCEGLPLALRIAAEVAVSPGATDLPGLVAQLADESQRLDVLDVDGDGRTAVRTVFSWSYRRLSPEAARAFRLLALHPGRDQDVAAAAALLDADGRTAARVVDHLSRAHLVEWAAPGRLQMHDLLRAYGRERAAQDGAAEVTAAVTRLLDHYLAVAHAAGGQAATDLLDAERANLVTVCGYAAETGRSRYAVELADALWRYLDNGAHYAEARTVHTSAVAAARRGGDRAGEAVGRHHLAVVYWRWGRNDTAWRQFTEALAAYRDVGDRRGEAAVLGNLGVLSWRWGRHHEARSYLAEAAVVFRETGNRAGEAGALGNQGLVAYRQGDYRASLAHLGRSLDIRRELGDRTGEARTLDNLGEVCQRVGRFAEAARFHEQALAAFRAAGDRYGEGRALCNRGEVHRHFGRYGQALADHLGAYAILDEIGDDTGRGEVALRLGVLHTAAGRADQGLAEGRRALTAFERVGDLNWTAAALNNLGEAHRALGQPQDSAERHRAARRVAARVGDTYERARAHEGLAWSLAGEDRPAVAAHRRAARALYLCLGVPDADRLPLTVAPGPAPR